MTQTIFPDDFLWGAATAATMQALSAVRYQKIPLSK